MQSLTNSISHSAFSHTKYWTEWARKTRQKQGTLLWGEVNIRIFTLAVCNAVLDTGLMSAMHHSFAVFPWICIIQLSVGPPVARWLTRYHSARKMTPRTPFLLRCLSLINYSCGRGCFARGLKWAVLMIIAASLYRVPKANSKSNSGTSSHWSSKQGCILLDICWKCC